MSFFLFKSVLAIFFLLAAIVAVISMLSLMGKTEKERKTSAQLLRKMHKGSGFVFTGLLLVISYFCLKYWAIVGDQISTRAALHVVLSLVLIIVLLLKILIVQFYKQFLKFAPLMGMIVFILSFTVFSTSAGFFFLRILAAESESHEISRPPRALIQGNQERGEALFNSKCLSCHYADKEEIKHGPGLKNILKKERLPSSKRQANVDNIKRQLKTPFLAMPSFVSLPEQEVADLLAYLKTL
ncbi:MAG: c-type cytochrome [Candidatus Aminicenantes bacterium]|nr:c-type cytochrome [Candidatus Aminicenantes bacterium]